MCNREGLELSLELHKVESCNYGTYCTIGQKLVFILGWLRKCQSLEQAKLLDFDYC